jgi:hypothetical protein
LWPIPHHDRSRSPRHWLDQCHKLRFTAIDEKEGPAISESQVVEDFTGDRSGSFILQNSGTLKGGKVKSEGT